MAAHREADRTPAQADGNDAVAGRIADAVDGLAELWTAAAAEASVRLSPHQLRALHALEAEPGANLTLLAERLEAGLPTVSRLCDRLEAAGLLLREAAPHNRREIQLWLTAHGRDVLAEVAELRSRALTEVVSGMAADDRAALERGLLAFVATLTGGG
ncbi:MULTISPECIES: MarR family transcriptional regulator [unclassified Streptomyces]|uniref:MarR family winged helix-turn-helix transcriptional regulator n=1 Tax=unclassified Streptomyces TaxID=2593676 RepID=UPI000B268815|nr:MULTISPECIES: MarR family transcriptional regulator [unclassified Streptomyces]